LRRDIPRPGDDDLVGRADFSTDHLNLVGDEQSKVLDVLALPPPS
jgi:hypothetical protein